MTDANRLARELKAQEQALASALSNRDVDTLSQLLAADYVFTNARGETWRRDRAIADLVDPQLSLGRIAVDLDGVVALGQAGVVTGRSQIDGRIGDRLLSGTYRFTHVWRRHRGRWQLVAGHTSAVTETVQA